MALRATDVFTPGAFPQHTYIERADQGLETALADALSTQGQLVSLSGPSKSVQHLRKHPLLCAAKIEDEACVQAQKLHKLR